MVVSRIHGTFVPVTLIVLYVLLIADQDEKIIYFSLLPSENVHFFVRCFVRSDTSRQLKQDLLESKIKVARNHVQSKSAFIRNVFHEIRTPMHVLTSFFSESDPSREDFEDMRHHTGETKNI